MTEPSARTRVRRLPERAAYDQATVYSILDEALICHVGLDDGTGPVVIPTIHARVEDVLYLHGSPASRMLRTIGRGEPLGVTATLVDGIVLAKSHFHSSMNYRSVVLVGTGRLVTDDAEKDMALAAFAEKMQPGRWEAARQPTDKERRATTVVAIPIREASAKTRTGGPKDDDDDLDLDFWAGVIPITTVRGAPEEHAADPL